MNTMDELLAVIENPTRRKILEALAREPHYALQLSKELGVSQPAVIKQLDLLQKSGLVTAHKEESKSGPMKTMYTTNSEFTIVVDLRNGMFNARLVMPEDNRMNEEERIEGLDKTRESISCIDVKIAELERMRSEMIRRREALISSALSAVSGWCGYKHRSLLYGLLNDPGKGLEDLSVGMNMNMNLARDLMDDIERTIRLRA